MAGTRVIELGTVLMVPLAAQILGDLGAEVIKIETIEGDPNRQLGDGPHPDLSGVSLNLNRNKRSLSVDLRAEEGIDLFRRLVETADVLLTNFRPAALTKLGVRYDDVTEWNENIVYCRSHGYASTSGLADRPAYDDVIQAASGLASLAERARGAPELLPTVVADKVCGLTIVYAVLAALLERTVTGRGQEVEVPMFDTMTAFTLVEHLAGATAELGRGAPGYDRVLASHRRPHRTADGWIVVMPYSPRDWIRLWTYLGRADYVDRLSGLSAHEVKRLAPEMYEWLEGHLPTQTTQSWQETLDSLDIAAAAVATLDELISGTAGEQGVLQPATHPVIGSYLQIRQPVRFASEPEPPTHAPLVGEQSFDILVELGIEPARASALIEAGVVRHST